MILVGSTALRLRGMSLRKPKDLDYFSVSGVEVPEEVEGRSVDIIPVNSKVMKTLSRYSKTIEGIGEVASVNAIYTIKCSHLGWSNPVWGKHKKDILVLQSKGCSIIPELYNVLVEYWKEDLGDKSFLNLDKSKEDFFNDFVGYQYDHDYLHELVAYPDPPAYTKCLRQGSDVMIDRVKFDNLLFEEQLRMFKEEIYVIALERWYLNDYWFDRGITWMKCYSLALQKTITNLTKGWATDFIVEQLKEFVIPDREIFERVLIKLNLKEKYMSKYLGEEGVKLIEEIMEAYNLTATYTCEDVEEFMSEVISDSYYGGDLKDFEHLEQDGGGEGGSEDCYAVFSWKGQVYRVNYNYYSHMGYENLDAEYIYKVTPQTEDYHSV